MWSAEARAEAMGRRGTRQADRIPKALADGYFQPDELSFEQLLALAVDHARLLRFPGQEQIPLAGRSDWEDLLMADEAVLIARILTLDLRAVDTDFRRFLEAYRQSGHTLPQLGAPLDIPAYRLARQLDAWSTRLATMPGQLAASLAEKLDALIVPGLVRELADLAAFLEHQGSPDAKSLYAGMRPLWPRGRIDQDPAHPPPGSDGPEAGERFLRGNFHAFHKAAVVLKRAAADALAESMATGRHDPAVGLYMAFISLYRQARAEANRFTQRHLDFYYRDVLGFRPKPAVADHTYLILGQDGTARHVPIPRGTAFSAGTDAHGLPLVFTADRETQVGKPRVAELRTLFFEKNPLISPEREFGLATGGKAATLPLANEADASRRAWPLFGAPKSHSDKALGEDANLGFALASPVLLLQEGYRDIDIDFDVVLETSRPGAETDTESDFRSVPLGEWLGELAQATGTTPLDAFIKTFRGMFRISLTTEKGWREVAEYLPHSAALEPGKGGEALGIRIRLGPDAEAVVPYSRTIHGGGYDTPFPVLRFTLNPATYLYPYTLLSRLLLRQVNIRVTVRGVKRLLVYNQLGQLDANTPFTPFGPSPSLGAYFQVGAQEAAQKRLSDLELELEWGDLPQTRGGFPEHYEAYDQPPANTDFRVGISTLKGGKWLPEEEVQRPQAPLFARQEDPSAPPDTIPDRQTLSCRQVVPLARPSAQLLEGGEYGYTPATKDGFCRLTLCSPDQAFGHRAYPPLLTRVLTDNARLRKPRLQKALPLAPYTPLIRSIALNYRAVATLTLDRVTPASRETGQAADHDRLFHIHPFGVDRVTPRSHRRIALLPDYPAQGNLFIGLEGDEPAGPLNLLFHLREDSDPSLEHQPSPPVWWYLVGNQWKRLDPARVCADGTRGFLSTGIVELDLPADMDRHHSVMPDGLYWLAVSVDDHPEALCSAYGIHAQALRVSRHLDEGTSYGGGELAAGLIKTSLGALPGINRISQPLTSTGGMPPEPPDRFKARVGERLRHKSRASLPWDYERLVLDQFPGIHMVKCFPNLVDDPEPARQVRPGHLLVVVVPDLEREASAHLSPQTSRLLLGEIHEYLTKRASPFARIQVRNPDYEHIQARCAVKLAVGAAGNQVQALNQAIVDYLSPWKTGGSDMRFGWRIRCLDLQAFIRNQPYVELVTRFSLLRVAGPRQDLFQLDDTVRQSGEQWLEVAPLQPWSLAVPFPRQHIETTESLKPVPPERTGLGQLEIGTTLIIS